MKRLVGATTAAVLIFFALAAPAVAQYPPTEVTCGVSDTQLAPGDTVTVSGDNWDAGSVVDISLEPEGIDLGSANVGGGGSFSTTVTIPSSVEAGPHSIVCSGADVEGLSVTSDSNIQVLGVVVPGADIAFTGSQSNVPLLAAIAVILALAGVVALVIGSRRRSKTTVASG